MLKKEDSIAPHGGQLVDRTVPAEERGEGGHGLGHQPCDLPLQLGDLLGEPPVTMSNGPHRQLGRGPQIFRKATRTEARRGCDQLGRRKAAPIEKLPSNGWQLSEWLNGLLTTLWQIRYSPIGASSQ